MEGGHQEGGHQEEDLLEGGHQEGDHLEGEYQVEDRLEGGQPEGEVHPCAWGQRLEDGEEFEGGLVDVWGVVAVVELEGVDAYSVAVASVQNPLVAVEGGSEGVGPWVEPCEVEALVAWVEPIEEASLASFLWPCIQDNNVVSTASISTC